jgi:hypothetical protein
MIPDAASDARDKATANVVDEERGKDVQTRKRCCSPAVLEIVPQSNGPPPRLGGEQVKNS